jgi:hypothetical protein
MIQTNRDINSILFITPFLISPRGEKIVGTPSPVGEGREGGNTIK